MRSFTSPPPRSVVSSKVTKMGSSATNSHAHLSKFETSGTTITNFDQYNTPIKQDQQHMIIDSCSTLEVDDPPDFEIKNLKEEEVQKNFVTSGDHQSMTKKKNDKGERMMMMIRRMMSSSKEDVMSAIHDEFKDSVDHEFKEDYYSLIQKILNHEVNDHEELKSRIGRIRIGYFLRCSGYKGEENPTLSPWMVKVLYGEGEKDKDKDQIFVTTTSQINHQKSIIPVSQKEPDSVKRKTHSTCMPKYKHVAAKRRRKVVVDPPPPPIVLPPPPPPPPEELKNYINGDHHHYSEIVFVIQKPLTKTDLSPTHDRLSMVPRLMNIHFLDKFLTENESRKLDKGEHIDVKLIDPNLQKYDLKLKIWIMKSSVVYVLTSKWKDVFKNNNGLEEGMVLQIWSFRAESKIWFALAVPQGN